MQQTIHERNVRHEEMLPQPHWRKEDKLAIEEYFTYIQTRTTKFNAKRITNMRITKYNNIHSERFICRSTTYYTIWKWIDAYEIQQMTTVNTERY